MKKFKPLFLLLLGSLYIGLSACVQHRELVSFPAETVLFPSSDSLQLEPLRIQPDDLLRITVTSFNPEAAAPFNVELPNNQQMQQQMMQGGGAQGNYPLELFNGYFVDQQGSIQFPVLGTLAVAGLTTSEVQQLISDKTKPYLRDAVVNVRLANLKINVLGEVNRPGIVRLSNQRISLLDAIGNAGDFTPYANRTNVLLVREENGKRIYQRLDFQSGELFQSPYYFLKQNDLLYVEPIRAKVATVQDPFARGITYGTAFVSIITLAVALFR
jgi:polysaccharide export outer membrane protein